MDGFYLCRFFGPAAQTVTVGGKGGAWREEVFVEAIPTPEGQK